MGVFWPRTLTIAISLSLYMDKFASLFRMAIQVHLETVLKLEPVQKLKHSMLKVYNMYM